MSASVCVRVCMCGVGYCTVSLCTCVVHVVCDRMDRTLNQHVNPIYFYRQ